VDTEKRIHLLKQITLPARFENLYECVGSDVARLLVRPKSDTIAALETASLAISARGEGMFVPLFGKSGRGKTTLARSLSGFLSSNYTETVDYKGKVEYDSLEEAVLETRKKLNANDQKIIPINLDHRESNPPSEQELAEIKRFLRSPSPGSRCIVFWPETSKKTAEDIAKRYIDVAGRQAIRLPLTVEGPARETWKSIATDTLQIANNLSSVEHLGVDPHDYNPEESRTIGEFMGSIANDLARLTIKLINDTRKPLSLAIVFVSGSNTSGVLNQLTNSDRFGLLDGNALVSATKRSRIGKWWDKRRSLLTRTIYQLDAHAFSLPPAASISILRTYGKENIKQGLREMDVSSAGERKVIRDLSRTDFGRHLLGEERSTFESRGKPPEKSTPAFNLLAEEGFTHGKDKELNNSVKKALKAFYTGKKLKYAKIVSEKKLQSCDLIPDNAIHHNEEIQCLKYTWRKGDYLRESNRAGTAGYILKKLKNYAQSLEWTND
jgi:energy-coupling factor transporter ATP-binding protein EcfA2